MTLRVVADDAIPFLDDAFGSQVDLVRVPGREITAKTLAGAKALMTRSITKVTGELVAGSSLKIVASATAGTDHVDDAAVARHGIAFASAAGCNANAVVQYVLTALAVADPSPHPIGVIGYGNVGSRLTRALLALGHEVLVSDPPLERGASPPDAPFVPRAELLRRCGTVTLHVPLTKKGDHPTLHLIGPEELASMSPGTLLINTSRGPVADNAALAEWVRDGGGRAVVDVWEGEPDIHVGLLRAATLATPHIAGYSLEGKLRATTLAAEAVAHTLGIDVRLDPADILGDSEPLLAASLTSALLHSCPLPALDTQLRAIVDRPDRAAAFERLRAKAPLRREPSHYRVRGPHPTAPYRAAGFDVA